MSSLIKEEIVKWNIEFRRVNLIKEIKLGLWFWLEGPNSLKNGIGQDRDRDRDRDLDRFLILNYFKILDLRRNLQSSASDEIRVFFEIFKILGMIENSEELSIENAKKMISYCTRNVRELVHKVI